MRQVCLIFIVFFSASSLFAEMVSDSLVPVYYEVQDENSLETIADKFGSTIDTLESWNGSKTDSLFNGLKLVVGFIPFSSTIPLIIDEVKASKIDVEDKMPDVDVISTSLQSDTKKNPKKRVAQNETTIEKKISSEPVELLFCGGIEQGVPVGVAQAFYRNVGAGYVYAFLEQQEPFLFRQLTVKIYKDNAQEIEPLSVLTFDIRPQWSHTFFKNQFDQPGQYVVRAFDEDNKLIAKGKVTILEK